MEREYTLTELQSMLRDFEAESWDAPDYEAGKTRHIALHLGKLLGRISEVAERREHALEPPLNDLHERVIPDLLYYALSLAEAHHVDLQDAFIKRLHANEERARSWVETRDTPN